MKKLIAIAMLVLASAINAQVSDHLLNAMIMQESAGNNHAIGDNGIGVGCLQIHPCVVDEVNAKFKPTYSYKDRFDRKLSKEICKKYLSIWATKKRLGRAPTNEDYARIWNGGPNGWKKTATKGYWNRLKVRL